eukprot:GHRQ01008182.1.p2 GENE.GHRQ01008182.1~~GHRQ01008182.1.p2  ORF type:complete len:120 (-),score=32.44 GHRQ01008182.1:398-757(-)
MAMCSDPPAATALATALSCCWPRFWPVWIPGVVIHTLSKLQQLLLSLHQPSSELSEPSLALHSHISSPDRQMMAVWHTAPTPIIRSPPCCFSSSRMTTAPAILPNAATYAINSPHFVRH